MTMGKVPPRPPVIRRGRPTVEALTKEQALLRMIRRENAAGLSYGLRLIGALLAYLIAVGLLWLQARSALEFQGAWLMVFNLAVLALIIRDRRRLEAPSAARGRPSG